MVLSCWGSRSTQSKASTVRSASITTTGANRGLYRHLLYYAIAAGVTVGDTITVGGATYTYVGVGNVWFETSAA